ncbi:MAG: hypothetical protein J1F17_00390 [Oscillospiraceae bacterium]|nr:hypothetical protein [Oscillospiraceae bacterium]
MKNKNTFNLVLSAFLIIAFVVCTYFFTTLNQTATVQGIINIIVTVVFGLILFYATRVGEGKHVKRFSLATLILLDIPALYIVLTSLAPGLPLSSFFGESQLAIYLAGIALGYGIPYTFFSGFELAAEDETEGFIEGGIMDEISADDDTEEDVEELEEAVDEAELSQDNGDVEVEINC